MIDFICTHFSDRNGNQVCKHVGCQNIPGQWKPTDERYTSSWFTRVWCSTKWACTAVGLNDSGCTSLDDFISTSTLLTDSKTPKPPLSELWLKCTIVFTITFSCLQCNFLQIISSPASASEGLCILYNNQRPWDTGVGRGWLLKCANEGNRACSHQQDSNFYCVRTHTYTHTHVYSICTHTISRLTAETDRQRVALFSITIYHQDVWVVSFSILLFF